MTFCFLRASLRFFWASYLNFPMSRILQTGGSALGEISYEIEAHLGGHAERFAAR
jgi:hypothetical protein